VSALAIGLAIYFALPALAPPLFLGAATRLLIAWNVAIVSYLVMVGFMMARSNHETMRVRAKVLDEGRHTVLVLAVVAALASLVTIILELYGLKSASTELAAVRVGVSIATILTAWSFVHVIFTEHYAHNFYFLDGALDEGGDDIETQKKKGLNFPGQPWPDYIDFLYFSVTIGVANQTADTEVVSRQMRVLVLIHSVISYFFNTIILALTINIAASMLGG
jgi:uncharacterized membrane protein